MTPLRRWAARSAAAARSVGARFALLGSLVAVLVVIGAAAGSPAAGSPAAGAGGASVTMRVRMRAPGYVSSNEVAGTHNALGPGANTADDAELTANATSDDPCSLLPLPVVDTTLLDGATDGEVLEDEVTPVPVCTWTSPTAFAEAELDIFQLGPGTGLPDPPDQNTAGRLDCSTPASLQRVTGANGELGYFCPSSSKAAIEQKCEGVLLYITGTRSTEADVASDANLIFAELAGGGDAGNSSPGAASPSSAVDSGAGPTAGHLVSDSDTNSGPRALDLGAAAKSVVAQLNQAAAARASAAADSPGCLKIVDERTGKAADGEMSIVGQEMHLKAVAVNEAGQTLATPVKNVTWTVPDRSGRTPLVLSSYDFYDGKPPKLVTDSDLHGNPLPAFFWTGVAHGSQTIEVDGTIDGQSDHASATISVNAPAISVHATTSHVGIRLPIGKRGWALSLGVNTSAFLPGISWGIDLTPVSGGAGQFGLTQLMRWTAVHSQRHQIAVCYATNGDYWLDDSALYANRVIELPDGGPEVVRPNFARDSPSTGLAQYGVWDDHRSFMDFFMYRPTGGKWVALGGMSWSYTGEAKAATDGILDVKPWEVVKSKTIEPPVHPAFQGVVPLPEWENVIRSGRPAPCPQLLFK